MCWMCVLAARLVYFLRSLLLYLGYSCPRFGLALFVCVALSVAGVQLVRTAWIWYIVWDTKFCYTHFAVYAAGA